MRRFSGSLALALGFWSGLAGDGQACGDKFLVIGRSVRGQRARGTVHKASILVYAEPGGRVLPALREIEPNLRFAGHKLRSVETRAALEQALGAGRFDIVLADISDVTALKTEAAAAPSRPYVLPVIYKASDEELAAAEQAYACVMRSPGKRQHYLAVIEDAMALRLKNTPEGNARGKP